MNDFGQKIETLRMAQNATRAEAASILGIPQSRLREIEKGIRVPTEGQVKRMEDYYGVKPGDLSALI